GDCAFDGLDGDRDVLDVERAGGFARRRADTAGHLREVVGGVQIARRLLPVAGIDEIVPIGDLVVDRAAGVIIRNPAIHAARGLLTRFLLGQRLHELAPMANPLFDRLVVAVVALELEKTGDLAHYAPAANNRGGCDSCAFISASARRYSIGMTLRNLGRYSSQCPRICAPR